MNRLYPAQPPTDPIELERIEAVRNTILEVALIQPRIVAAVRRGKEILEEHEGAVAIARTERLPHHEFTFTLGRTALHRIDGAVFASMSFTSETVAHAKTRLLTNGEVWHEHTYANGISQQLGPIRPTDAIAAIWLLDVAFGREID